MQKYPVIESIINLVNEFKEMLKSKSVEKVEEWIEKANNLKIRKLFLLKNADRIQHVVKRTSIWLAIALGISNITEKQKDVMYNVYDVIQNTKKLSSLENEINNKIF
jgi:hypothetical protein